ncbi:MAG: adenylate/guanylate cyclase domain-containing protein [Hyphomicrobiaceae bacterium]
MTTRLITWLAAVAFGAVAGHVYTLLFYDALPPAIADTWPGVRAGALIAGVSSAFEIFAMRRGFGIRLRRQPFLVFLILRICIHTVLVVAGLFSNRAISALLIGRIVDDAFKGGHMVQDTIYSFFVIALFLFFLQTQALIGARTLLNVVLGRYYRPVREERIFLLIDLAGSTPLATDLGDERFYEFLSAFFFEIDSAIVEHGGEVYTYVGDAMIATWPLGRPEANAQAVHAVFAARAHVAGKAAWFRERFGRIPHFRAIVHGGPVVSGECGDSRRQITYLGDVLNTTARLETLCKQLDVETLVSRAMRERMDLPDRFVAVDLGSHALKGVSNPLAVLSLAYDGARQPLAAAPAAPSHPTHAGDPS